MGHIPIVCLGVLLVFLTPGSATLLDLVHGFHSFLRSLHRVGHNHDRIAGSSANDARPHRFHRFGHTAEGEPLNLNPNVDTTGSASRNGNLVAVKAVHVKGTGRPVLVVGGLQGRALRTTASPGVKRTTENAVTTDETGGMSTTSAPISSTSSKAPSRPHPTRKHIPMTDLKIPGGENPANEDIPDYAVFQALRPAKHKKVPSKSVPAKSVKTSLSSTTESSSGEVTITEESSSSEATTTDVSSSEVTTTEVTTTVDTSSNDETDTFDIDATNEVSTTSTTAPSTGESARESVALSDTSARKARNQLALDVNDLFQVIE